MQLLLSNLCIPIINVGGYVYVYIIHCLVRVYVRGAQKIQKKAICVKCSIVPMTHGFIQCSTGVCVEN